MFEKLKTGIKDIIYKIKEKKLPKPSEKESMLILELRNNIKNLPSIIINEKYSEAQKNWLNNLINRRKDISDRDPRMFLNWEVITRTMFSSKGGINELEYLKKLPNWHFWNEAIKESPMGSPRKYDLNNNSSSNLVHLAYSASKIITEFNIDVKKIKFIFEFGGGYGGMCRLFYRLGFPGKYTIYDLPEFSFLQKYYLKSLDPADIDIEINTNEQRSKQCTLVSSINKLEKN